MRSAHLKTHDCLAIFQPIRQTSEGFDHARLQELLQSDEFVASRALTEFSLV